MAICAGGDVVFMVGTLTVKIGEGKWLAKMVCVAARLQCCTSAARGERAIVSKPCDPA